MTAMTQRLRWTATMYRPVLASALALALGGISACSNPQSGPDKTLGGAVLGAGWGAGAGAVIGNQINNTGPGAAVGAGFGFVQGALTGAGYDLAEGAMIDQEHQLAALKIQNLANGRELDVLQDKLDHAITTDNASGVYQVFFDPDATSMRLGATANLEVIAESVKKSTHAAKIYVIGHADDAGSPEYNARLAEARARSVAGYLAARGIATDQIILSSFGSKRPLATNGSAEGRQLNRRVDVYIGH